MKKKKKKKGGQRGKGCWAGGLESSSLLDKLQSCSFKADVVVGGRKKEEIMTESPPSPIAPLRSSQPSVGLICGEFAIWGKRLATGAREGGSCLKSSCKASCSIVWPELLSPVPSVSLNRALFWVSQAEVIKEKEARGGAGGGREEKGGV